MEDIEIAFLGGGYGWSKVYYSPFFDRFYEDSWHCGSVDICEDFYDGREFLSDEEVWNLLKSEDTRQRYLKIRKTPPGLSDMPPCTK